MIKIYKDKHNTTNFVVKSTCISPENFLLEFAEALSVIAKAEEDYSVYSVLKVAMPIVYKLSGYKADEVHEERVLVCGNVSPENCDVVAAAGR